MENEAILNQLPIDREVCFTNEKGEPSDKVKKHQGKVLGKVGLMGASIFIVVLLVLNKLVAIDHVRYYVRQFMPADINL